LVMYILFLRLDSHYVLRCNHAGSCFLYRVICEKPKSCSYHQCSHGHRHCNLPLISR
jgi:hypothetical protein